MQLSAAGPLARDQRLQHRLGDGGRGREIEMRQMTEHLAAPVFGPGDTAPSAERLHRRVDSRLTRHRTNPAIGGSRDIDHPRINFGDDLVAESEPLDRARPHVLHKHVALLDDLERDGAVALPS